MNHFTANPNHLYLGQDRRHRFDATENPVDTTEKGDRQTVTILPSASQLIRLIDPKKLTTNPKSIKWIKGYLRGLPLELLQIVLNGNPEPFTIELGNGVCSAINFYYRDWECDLFLTLPILIKWVDQDQFFRCFEDFKEAINEKKA